MKLFQSNEFREKLVSVALEWQEKFGNAPAITTALSEYDAAHLVGMNDDSYSAEMKHHSVVNKGSISGSKKNDTKSMRADRADAQEFYISIPFILGIKTFSILTIASIIFL